MNDIENAAAAADVILGAAADVYDHSRMEAAVSAMCQAAEKTGANMFEIWRALVCMKFSAEAVLAAMVDGDEVRKATEAMEAEMTDAILDSIESAVLDRR